MNRRNFLQSLIGAAAVIRGVLPVARNPVSKTGNESSTLSRPANVTLALQRRSAPMVSVSWRGRYHDGANRCSNTNHCFDSLNRVTSTHAVGCAALFFDCEKECARHRTGEPSCLPKVYFAHGPANIA